MDYSLFKSVSPVDLSSYTKIFAYNATLVHTWVGVLRIDFQIGIILLMVERGSSPNLFLGAPVEENNRSYAGQSYMAYRSKIVWR